MESFGLTWSSTLGQRKSPWGPRRGASEERETSACARFTSAQLVRGGDLSLELTGHGGCGIYTLQEPSPRRGATADPRGELRGLSPGRGEGFRERGGWPSWGHQALRLRL